ncbi:GerW family sporulation protein [Peribacillus kribbensis]|uniref:GerW family sporulation protein n=1 Tax=Peribacillus kribbensis TaxID=356658 RepID=UPI0004127D8E|nr:GerW family sporulation protein [Peribacillus kribbensis]
MSEHPLQGLMNSAMENLKQMIDVNTIIGDPVETPDGSVILTVSKVGFGFAAGGSDFKGGNSSGKDSQDAQLPFGGGSGGGVSITPIAFLVVSSNEVKMLHLDQSAHLIEKLIDMAPSVVEKIQSMMSKMGGSQDQSKSGKSNSSDKDKSQKKDSSPKQSEPDVKDFDI